VLGWAAAYATGVVPVDLPPLTAPAPPLADMRLEHLENPEGLGPNLPLNVHGLPSTDPLARMPLIDLTSSGVTPPQPMWPWQQPAPRAPSCTVICIGPDPGSQQPPWLALPPPDAAPSAQPQTAPPGPPLSPPSVAVPPPGRAANTPVPTNGRHREDEVPSG
jgi:hypothetical protein